MTRDDMVELMKSSKCGQEWDDNCDRVKKANGGYPAYWFDAMLESGLARKIMSAFGETPDIKVVEVNRGAVQTIDS